MTPLDRQLFLAINNGLKCDVNDLWLGNATWLGNGWVAFPLAVIILFFLDKNRFKVNLFALAIAGVVGGLMLNLVKSAVAYPRPLTVFASDISAGRVTVNVMFDRLYFNSMPSGHTQTVFTIAVVLLWAMKFAGKLNWRSVDAVLLCACVVGVSRIYVGAHFPSDITCGAILGGGISFCCCKLVELRTHQQQNRYKAGNGKRRARVLAPDSAPVSEKF